MIPQPPQRSNGAALKPTAAKPERRSLPGLILLIAVASGQLVGLHFYKHSKGISFYFLLIVFVILIIVFMILTIYPPHIPLFYDEKAGGYGITA